LNFKLSIARNLALQYKNDFDKLKNDFDIDGKNMVIKNVELILKQRKLTE
jgi:hypothetical protein